MSESIVSKVSGFPKAMLRLARALALPDLHFYDNEIAFFRNAKIRSTTSFDKDVLGAEIRFLAHVLEKDIIAHDQRRYRHLRRELAEKTAMWQKSFPIDDPTYDWAVNILRLYDSNTKEGIGSVTMVCKPDLLEAIRTRRSIRR